jgi:catalase
VSPPHFCANEITVRFSDNTGIPTLADAAPQARPHGMAIRFHLPDGTDTDLVTHSLNGFPAKTAEDMRQFILAATASGPGVAAPTPIQKYLEAHPEAKPFATAPGPAPVSYGTIAYFGVNTFKFIAADGKATFGRYQIIPEMGKQFLSKDEAVNASHDYLLDEIRTRVAKGPVRFKFVLQLPVPGDKLDDPSIPWSDTNKTSELGTIEITSIVPDSDATQRALLFLPSLLPDGIEPADPMIQIPRPCLSSLLRPSPPVIFRRCVCVQLLDLFEATGRVLVQQARLQKHRVLVLDERHRVHVVLAVQQPSFRSQRQPTSQ